MSIHWFEAQPGRTVANAVTTCRDLLIRQLGVS
jgi:hypothetical protein